MNSVNFNVTTQNVNFTAKVKVNKKNANEIIDAMNDKAVEFLNKDRPLEEKREMAIRKSLENIFKKFGFGKKLRNAGEEAEKQNNIIDSFNKVYNDYKLKRLAKNNPDEAREQLMRESLEDIGRFFKDV